VSRRYARSIVWLRRDLRLHDNAALYESACASESLCIAYVLDPQLLHGDRMGAPLVASFFSAIAELRSNLRKRASDLALFEGDCALELVALARRAGAEAVFYNEDYEPDAIVRDARVAEALARAEIDTQVCLDHVYFGAGELLQSNGNPYQIFTPYKRRWLDARALGARLPYPSNRAIEGKLLGRDEIGPTVETPTPEMWGFASSAKYPTVSESAARAALDTFVDSGRIERYRDARDFPARPGTSHLSPQLRAGTIGIRTCVERAFECLAGAAPLARTNVETWISELVWRDFYQMVLKRWPHVASKPFLEAAERIVWRRSHSDFEAWCAGKTGYPIVDAAMRQLNSSGWMHNRLRMICASFLTKDLLIDWRWGERYFERQLADADLAQNNGGWQWSASTGTDSVPYFRIFNPILQGKRFDPEGAFIRTMLPELARVPDAFVHAPWEMPPLVAAEAGVLLGTTYPEPIVEHAQARERAIRAFAVLKRSVKT
jgi:deoxyribodipyrimidine photo-lyase